MRFAALVLVLILAGCGGVQRSSEFGDVTLALDDTPGANEAGVYLATQRGYDAAEGVTLTLTRDKPADFRVIRTPPRGCVTVLAIVRPSRLVLCADEITLQDERPKVVAVARALARGYRQAQLEPDEAVAAMEGQIPGLDREQLSDELDAAVPTWTEGAAYFGQLSPGPGRDPTIATDANTAG